MKNSKVLGDTVVHKWGLDLSFLPKMYLHVVGFHRKHWWRSYYVWAGLLSSCCLIQAVHLHSAFVMYVFYSIFFGFEPVLLSSMRIPYNVKWVLCISMFLVYLDLFFYDFQEGFISYTIIRSYISLPLAILPWLACTAFYRFVFHIKQPLNNRCHMETQWAVPIYAFMCYILVLWLLLLEPFIILSSNLMSSRTFGDRYS